MSLWGRQSGVCVSQCIGGGVKLGLCGVVGGGVPEVQILRVANLSGLSHQKGNHNVNPFRVTPTGPNPPIPPPPPPHAEPLFIQDLLKY